MSGKTLAVKLTTADYDHYQKLASDAGLTLADWTRRKLAEPPRPAPVVLDEAFRRLDVSDHMRELTGTPPPPPVRPTHLPIVTEGTRATMHSCVFNAALQQSNATTVCTNTSQYGRPCYWPTAGAKDCLYFSPRGG